MAVTKNFQCGVGTGVDLSHVHTKETLNTKLDFRGN